VAVWSAAIHRRFCFVSSVLRSAGKQQNRETKAAMNRRTPNEGRKTQNEKQKQR
jgi:hypothetical protein